MSNKEIAKSVFDEMVIEGKSRDEIVVAMVMKGVSLNSAQIYYKEFAVESGISGTKIGYKTEALEFIAEQVAAGVDVLDADQRSTLRQQLQDKFSVAQSTANDYIKAWATTSGVELPTSNFGGTPEDREEIFNWISVNKNCTKNEFKDFMTNTMKRGKGSVDETWRGVELARRLQAAGIVFDQI